MKHLFFIMAALIMLSCSQDVDVSDYQTEAGFLSVLQSKGGPNKDNFFKGGTATQDIVIDGAGYNLTFKNFGQFNLDDIAFIHFRNYFYMRRETNKSDPFNYRFLEETSNRDWLATVSNAGTGRGTRLFLDGNPDSSNFELLAEEGNAGSKGFRGNNGWFLFEELKTFETKAEAHANGVVGLFKNSEGQIFTTK